MRGVRLGLILVALLPASASAAGFGHIDSVFRPATKDLVNYVQGSDGNMWSYGTRTPSIARVTPAGKATVFTAGLNPEMQIRGIAAGPDGNVWFSYIVVHKASTSDTVTGSGLGRVTPAGAITTFDLPRPDADSFLYPNELTAAGDGNLWVALGYEDPGAFDGDTSVTGLGRVNVADQTLKVFPLSNDSITPVHIERDGNDALWFTAGGVGGETVGRATLDGTSTLFKMPRNTLATDLAVGSDHNAWVVSQDNPTRILRVTATGVISQFKDSSIPNLNDTPPVIGSGPDGNLWVSTTGGVDVFATSGKRVHRIGYGFTHPNHDERESADIEGPVSMTAGPGGMWVTVPLDFTSVDSVESGLFGVDHFARGVQPALRVSCRVGRQHRLSGCKARRTTSASADPPGKTFYAHLLRKGKSVAAGVEVEGKHRLRALVVREPGVKVGSGTYVLETDARSRKIALKVG